EPRPRHQVELAPSADAPRSDKHGLPPERTSGGGNSRAPDGTQGNLRKKCPLGGEKQPKCRLAFFPFPQSRAGRAALRREPRREIHVNNPPASRRGSQSLDPPYELFSCATSPTTKAR